MMDAGMPTVYFRRNMIVGERGSYPLEMKLRQICVFRESHSEWRTIKPKSNLKWVTGADAPNDNC